MVAAQAAHSVEEYVGRLWESFPPATFLTRFISADRELGFIVLNGALVAFGLWCLLWPVRREWQSAAAFAWLWVGVETINGVVHPAWTILQGGYPPGVLTASLLLVLALHLASRLRRAARPAAAGEFRA
ncbi:MAG TPA: HXXEE domain-containing protein [Longimicrobiales bacterium]|nr:HXXEE domain-containing protein [Longimicrobiales bacterium]